MSARSKARKRALDVIYEADIRGLDAAEVLRATEARRSEEGQAAMNSYAVELVEGVAAHREYIDELLGSYSMGWTLERMPAVDRAILRIGAFEVLWREDIPDAVAVSEAVTLAQELSTDESSSFVNGLLGRLVELKPRLQLGTDTASA
ncbi:MAG: transcription antitermination factor NusB [Actinomycetales bacterium]|nr:transcription antitermination factor NusB [Actinomycetales bacterium]